MKQRLSRRDFLQAVGVAALASGCATPAAAVLGEPVNDVHSRLNRTRVRRIVTPSTSDDLIGLVRSAARDGEALAIAGGRHAMGGQQFLSGGTLVDTRGLHRILDLDTRTGVVEVEAGIQWPELVAGLLERQQGQAKVWTIAQKQTGADRLCIGGALAANIHGRGLRMRPIIDDVVSFTLVNGRGELVECSRKDNADLFRLAIGGYGLFGVIYSVRLKLRPRHKVVRNVTTLNAEEVIAAFDDRIGDGHEYGDFQFAIDPASEDFVRHGIMSCYKPVPDDRAITDQARELSERDWGELLYLAHADKAKAFTTYKRHYVATDGQVYWSDLQQFSAYPEGYHAGVERRMRASAEGSEMITEIYVPREELSDFLHEARLDFRNNETNLIYGTVRLIEKDDESFLAWARESFACVIFNLHVAHSEFGVGIAAEAFRRLIALAIKRKGSFYLTYHRYATADQLLACHPMLPEFLQLKKKFDPAGRFQSDWYRHISGLLA